MRFVLDDGIQSNDQLAHAGGQRDLWSFSGATQAAVEISE
jgi:hypothetical protein